MIERKRGSGFCRFYRFKGVGAAQIIMKRRGVFVVISSAAEKSIWQNAHCLM